MIPGTSPENYFSIYVDDIIDVALHHEIKVRAYELFERRHDIADGHDLRDELQAELPRVAYAAAQLQKHSKGDDTRAVRAARIYLRALSSFITVRVEQIVQPSRPSSSSKVTDKVPRKPAKN